jgi:predicted Zn-dependent protease
MTFIAPRRRLWLAAAAGVLLALLSNAATAETVEVAPGVRVTKKTFAAPVNEQPFYGFVEKTPQMREADEKFKAAVLKVTVTQQKAVEEMARRAWSAFFAGDIPEATRRFNQASLFDPSQSAIFHGFALIVVTRFNDPGYAEELLKIARTQPNPSNNLNADYGRFLLVMKRPRDAEPVLEQAVVDNPAFATAWSNLAFARHANGNSAGACAASIESSRHAPPANVQSDLEILRTQAKCK